jgi:hypothetical protein
MSHNIDKRTTNGYIDHLEPDEVFVFGSNLAGAHGGGAAAAAHMFFGAVWGQGVGLQGQSYAIPTMQGGVETIKPYVDDFIRFALEHPEKRFLVTPIGCGIAGFTPEEIAPLFHGVVNLENVSLPESFWKVLKEV